MSAVTLSYVLSTKDKLPFLREVLPRLLRNVSHDEEVVVVDGASTDGTAEYLAELHAQGRIHRLVSEPDRGASHGLNKGLLLCAGELIKPLSDEDAFHYPAIRECKRFLLEHPDVDALAGTVAAARGGGSGAIEVLWEIDARYRDWLREGGSFAFRLASLLIRKRSLPLLGLVGAGPGADLEYTRRVASSGSLAWYRSAVAVISGDPAPPATRAAGDASAAAHGPRAAAARCWEAVRRQAGKLWGRSAAPARSTSPPAWGSAPPPASTQAAAPTATQVSPHPLPHAELSHAAADASVHATPIASPATGSSAEPLATPLTAENASHAAGASPPASSHPAPAASPSVSPPAPAAAPNAAHDASPAPCAPAVAGPAKLLDAAESWLAAYHRELPGAFLRPGGSPPRPRRVGLFPAAAAATGPFPYLPLLAEAISLAGWEAVPLDALEGAPRGAERGALDAVHVLEPFVAGLQGPRALSPAAARRRRVLARLEELRDAGVRIVCDVPGSGDSSGAPPSLDADLAALADGFLLPEECCRSHLPEGSGGKGKPFAIASLGDMSLVLGPPRSRDEARAALGLPGGVRVIAWPTEPWPEEEAVLATCVRAPAGPLRLVLAGDGKRPLAPGTGTVVLDGPADAARMRDLLCAADVAIVPPGPLALAAARAALGYGVPVVTPRAGAAADAAREAGILVDDWGRGVARVIEAAGHLPEDRRWEMADAARKRSLDRPWWRTGEACVSLYEVVTGGGAAPEHREAAREAVAATVS